MREAHQSALAQMASPRKGGSSFRGSGIDKKSLNELVGGSLTLEGLLKEGEGRFVKAKGHQTIKTIGSAPVTLIEPYTGEWYAVAYGDKVGIWHPDTGTVAEAGSTSFTTDPFTGGRYGNRFYLCNGSTKIGYLTVTLAYDTQTANFTAGKTLTGGTSGATAVIVADTDGGATGTLTLKEITGVFADNETITDNNGTPGSAAVNGTLTCVFTALSNAPMAKVVRVGQKELYAGNITNDGSNNTDPTSVWVSNVDVGSGIPDTWTEGVDLGDAYRVRWGGAGAVNDIIVKDKLIVILHEFGRHGYQLVFEADGSGGIDQRVEDVFFNTDYGGYRGAVSTRYGIFYTNPHGVYLLTGGQGDSVEESNILALFDERTIKDYDFSDADIEYLPTKDLLVITCRYQSGTNNAIIFYNIPQRQISTRKAVTFKRMALTPDRQALYATDAQTGKIYLFLNGYDDDGKAISAKIEKEESFGGISTVKSAHNLVIHGRLGEQSTVTIIVDVWDDKHRLTPEKHRFTWTLDSNGMASQNGYNELGYSEPSESAESSVIEAVGHFKIYIPRFTKIRYRIEELSMLPFQFHEIRFEEVEAIRGIHKNNLTPTT